MPKTASPTPDDNKKNKYSVPAVEKALDVLEHLSDRAVPLTQSQIARALGRQPGEIFRMLTCLESRGYLRRDPVNGGYILTLKLFELSRAHSPHDKLLQTAQPLMRELADTIGESCHLCVLHRGQVMVLAQEQSPQPFRLSVEAGSLHSPVLTTSGRVLLAHLPAAERDTLLNQRADFVSMPSAGRRQFLAQLEVIRDRGYEYADGEKFVGGLDLGVPVGTPHSQTQAALTVATLKRRDGPDLLEALPRLTRCAQDIAHQAGLLMHATAGELSA